MTTVTGSFMQSHFLVTQGTTPRIMYCVLVVKVIPPRRHELRVMLRFMAWYSEAQARANPSDWTSFARLTVDLSNGTQMKSQVQHKPQSDDAINKMSQLSSWDGTTDFHCGGSSELWVAKRPSREQARSTWIRATPSHY